MKSKLWLVNLGFIPHSVNCALLFLRLALGGAMLALHGWDKLMNFHTMLDNFPDPIGIGRHLSFLLSLFAELGGSALLIVGAVSRFAAAVLVINMSVALFMVHHGDLTRAGGGEPAALYLIGFLTILIAGPGRFSADGAGGPWALAGFGAIAGVLAGYPLSYCFQPDGHPATASLPDYIGHIGGVLHDDALRTTAWGVWIGTVLVLALAGFFVGRAMYRRTVRVVATEPERRPDQQP